MERRGSVDIRDTAGGRVMVAATVVVAVELTAVVATQLVAVARR